MLNITINITMQRQLIPYCTVSHAYCTPLLHTFPSFQGYIVFSRKVSAEDFSALVEKAFNLMCNESGQIGNLNVTGKLVELTPVGEALVVGDLHGDLQSLAAILRKSNFVSRMTQEKNAAIIFLGDYGDRGPKSTELIYVILMLKLAFPRQVILLRGNHEGPSDLMASPHDLPLQLQRKFKEKWVLIYQKLTEFFSCLYIAVYVKERYLMVHGGLPAKVRSLEEITQADQLHPDKPFLEELLWNDPEEEVNGTYPSPRGAGILFSKQVTQEVLGKLNAKVLIRGHEPAGEGFKINHDGKVLTLFSRKGAPYFNKHAAYLDMPLDKMFENANQLLPYIHKF